MRRPGTSESEGVEGMAAVTGALLSAGFLIIMGIYAVHPGVGAQDWGGAGFCWAFAAIILAMLARGIAVHGRPARRVRR
jgi:hypothetical protein